jgi:hypothetical protein
VVVANVFPGEAENSPAERHESVFSVSITPARFLTRVIRGAIKFDREFDVRIREVDPRRRAVHGDFKLRRGGAHAGLA